MCLQSNVPLCSANLSSLLNRPAFCLSSRQLHFLLLFFALVLFPIPLTFWSRRSTRPPSTSVEQQRRVPEGKSMTIVVFEFFFVATRNQIFSVMFLARCSTQLPLVFVLRIMSLSYCVRSGWFGFVSSFVCFLGLRCVGRIRHRLFLGLQHILSPYFVSSPYPWFWLPKQ